ncbi:LacI family DNA-binding transcriptional regulator [Cohnella soli]|uniref:LacI family DNA-binding transcriptional regulator n=1 Tax=Cohnella soli TaxID=425005 RepID=A0ABW0HL77_9BACL
MHKSVTIHDIAKAVNVSSATVSRVLSNSDYPVSSELKMKIQQAAKDMAYVPNMLGKQLKTKQSRMIGVIVPTITNPFYSSVMLGIEEVARKNDFQVMLCNTLQDSKVENEYVKTIFEKQIKGLIISSISPDQNTLSDYIKLGLKVIAIDQQIDLDHVRQVGFDYRKGGYLATRHLLKKGHTKIAYVTAPLDRPSRKSVYEGYMDALREAGIERNPEWVRVEGEMNDYSGISEYENGRRLTCELLALADRPTAIFACNDMTAFGVINELANQSVRVPEEMSVIGFDDIEFSRMVTPALTTVRQPDYEMGKLACSMLFDILDGEKEQEMGIMLQPKLIERQSVAAPPD